MADVQDIGRYRYADCTLFRVPPIDFSPVSSDIESILMKAWENGSRVDNALDMLINSGAITRKLATQITQHLQFQRESALATMQGKKEEALREYNAQREEELKSLEAALGPAMQYRQGAAREAIKKTQETRQAYSASQARLEELRSRVRSTVAELGGQRGYSTLTTIREQVLSYGAPPAQATAPAVPKAPYAARSAAPLPSQQQPLYETAHQPPPAKLEGLIKQEKSGRIRRIVRRLRSLLRRGSHDKS